MKNIKKIYLVVLLLLPTSVFAGGNMVGTAPILDALGAINIYYQHKLSEKSAVVVAYGSVNGSFSGSTADVTTYSASYKGYFNQYANGGYWEVGAVVYNVGASSGGLSISGSGTLPMAVVGYEKTLGTNFVVGGEVGFGTGHGWGVLGINAAYMF